MALEVELSLIESELAAGAGTGEVRRGKQLVVFEEADEDTREHPGDGALRDLLAAPHLVAFSGSSGRSRRLVFGAEVRIGFGVGGDPFGDGGFEGGDFFLEV